MIMCILVWIHACVALSIVVGAWLMAGRYGGFLSIIILSPNIYRVISMVCHITSLRQLGNVTYTVV